MSNFILQGQRVLIEEAENESKTESGFIISPKNDPSDPQMGKVVAVGKGGMNEHGIYQSVDIPIGAQVMYQYGAKIMFEGKSYVLVNASDIIMVI